MELSMNQKIEVKICMGSSCFSRGNNKTLETIQKYREANKDWMELNLKGTLCRDCCAKGPNIMINEKLYHNVRPENVLDILNLYRKETEKTASSS